MTPTVYTKDRRTFVIFVTLYGLTSLTSVAAVGLCWWAVVQPTTVVVIDAQHHARVIEHTVRPEVTRAEVTAFAEQFAPLVAVHNHLTAEDRRAAALSMMSVPLATYERQQAQRQAHAVHRAVLERDAVVGYAKKVEAHCTRSPEPRFWTCYARGEAAYPQSGSELRVRGFLVQMTIETVRTTRRSPAGMLVNVFQVIDDVPATAVKQAGAKDKAVDP